MKLHKKSLLWIIPLSLFILFIPFSSSIDIVISSYFLGDHEKFQAPAWSWTVYRYGLRPGQTLFIVSSMMCAIYALFKKKKMSIHMLYISLCLAIGSGCIGHGLLKKFWQRPRPKQVVLFGGTYPFCSLSTRYTGPADRHLRSLPSGHATMGFYFFALYFLGRRTKQKWLSYTGLTLGFFLGGLLSITRLCQGGHYFSDVFCSAVLMWLIAYWLDYLLYKKEHDYDLPQTTPSS